MRWMLFLFAVLAGVAGLYVLTQSASVLHEIAAFMFWLIGSVFLVGGAVVEAVGALGVEVRAARSDARRALARGAREKGDG